MPHRFPAVRFVQNRRTFYALSLSSGFFIDHAVVDVYDPTLSVPGHPKGYQRAVEEGRARKIADYLKTNSSVLPTSILLNVRHKEALRWEGDKETSGSPGVLIIPDGATVYVVDGQHRQAGLAVVAKTRPSIREFPVPAVLMEGFEMVDEALQFYLINTKAKKVPTDLSRRLLLEFDQVQYLEAPKKWILNALRVTIALESKLDNPWRGKIRPANAAKQPHHICSERSFVPSLQYVLNNKRLQKKPAKTLSRIMAEYWKGLERTFGPAFGNPKAHRIQKSQGFYALHIVAPYVISDLIRRKKPLTAGNFENRLQKLGSLTSGFWAETNTKGARRFGGGLTGFQNLASFLLKRLGLG